MIDINSRSSIFAIIYLAVVGPCVFILQPGYVQGLVEYLGLSEQEAGLIASFEVFGIAATAILLSFITQQVPWHFVLRLCCLLSAAGNFASIGQADFQVLMVLRFLTGVGSGGLISLTFMLMGLTVRSDRNLGYLVTWLLIWGALGLLLMPQAYQHIGMNGVLVVFGLFCASGLLVVKNLPNTGESIAERRGKTVSYHDTVRRVSLAAMLVYNISIGIVWAYLFRVGTESGMQEQAVANALTVSQFLGIAGAFMVVVLELRVGRLLPLGIGVLGGAMSVFLLVGDLQASGYWVAVCLFNFLWNFSVPYLFAFLADFDERGQTMSHAVSMQFLGLAVGPFIASQLVEVGGFDMVNSVAVALFIVSAALLLPGLRAQHHRNASLGGNP